MNIFHTDRCPVRAAKNLCDKHVPKMVLETVQMLCATHHMIGYAPPPLYAPTHKNHPMTKWVGQTLENYLWTLEHAFALGSEYEFRFNKMHASMAVLPWLPSALRLPKEPFTAPPQCMPDEYKDVDYVVAYRNYYIGDKVRFAKWGKGRTAPEWWNVI